MARWFIDSIEIAGGFLAGFSQHLPRGLICVIGPRGSGKSTLAEAFRYGVAGATGASRPRLDLVRANLASAVITIRTTDSDGNPAYTIKRAPGQSPILLGNDGHSIISVDLDRGTFLPLDGYSSQEIEDIAKESLGERRRALLDELRGEELHQLRLAIAEHRRALEANADAIRSARKLITDHTERIEELGDVRARLAASTPLSASQESNGLILASKQRQANERELANLQQAASAIRQFRQALADLITRNRAILSRSITVSASQNSALLDQAHRAMEGAASLIESPVEAILGTLTEAEAQLESIAMTLGLAHSSQNAEFVRLQAENQVASEAVRERTRLEQAVARLESLEGERANAQRELDVAMNARKSLKGAYLLERDRISSVREEVAKALQNEAGNKVRVRVVRNADSLTYRQTLLQALQGARVRNHDDILRSLMRLRPEELAQIIQDGDGEELENQTNLGQDRSDKILEAFRHAIDPLDLEVVEIDDRVCIELNVSSSSEPNFKDAAELSRGQMCTALLPQLLARRNTPLVIDQPEDNLDNHFIYETIVESVRRLKGKRQMIFITHNANIPVLAEAELVIVLNSDGKTGFVQKAGTLDECRNEIVDLLEGGELAFEMRRKRYAK